MFGKLPPGTPTPLIIFQARHGNSVEEVSRHRSDEIGYDFYSWFVGELEEATANNPDEVIIRLLRPQPE